MVVGFDRIAAGLLAGGLLVASAAAEDIFNGKNLKGWNVVSSAPTDRAVWSVEDGIITCRGAGAPSGYIRTTREFENYTLELEWRWPTGSEPGNNGVLVHASDPNALGIWPRSIEAQLFHKNAGDIWVIGTTIDIPDKETRVNGRRHLKLGESTEKEAGEWNQYKIVAKGDTLELYVNGEVKNKAANLSHAKGAICLQAEGADCQFRNLKLTPLD